MVNDRGVGLEPQELRHLFQPFFTQLDPSRHSSGDFGFCKRGLGLGLSIAKQFVEMHGGQIAASREGAERGYRSPARCEGADGARRGSSTRVSCYRPNSTCCPDFNTGWRG